MKSSNFTYDEIRTYGDKAARQRAEAVQSWREQGWSVESLDTVGTNMDTVTLRCSFRRVPEAAELAEARLDRATRNLIVGSVFDAKVSEAADRVESKLEQVNSALASAAARLVRDEQGQ